MKEQQPYLYLALANVGYWVLFYVFMKSFGL